MELKQVIHHYYGQKVTIVYIGQVQEVEGGPDPARLRSLRHLGPGPHRRARGADQRRPGQAGRVLPPRQCQVRKCRLRALRGSRGPSEVTKPGFRLPVAEGPSAR